MESRYAVLYKCKHCGSRMATYHSPAPATEGMTPDQVLLEFHRLRPHIVHRCRLGDLGLAYVTGVRPNVDAAADGEAES